MSSPNTTPLLNDDALSQARTTDLAQIFPPGAQYVRTDEQLVIDLMSNLPRTLTLNYRMMQTDGVVIENQTSLAVTVVDGLQTFSIPLTEGYLLGFNISSPIPIPTGNVYGFVSIGRAIGGGTFLRTQTLSAGYITRLVPLSFPPGTFTRPTETSGQLLNTNAGTPALGQEVDLQVPTSHRYTLLAGFLSFVASATVANRLVAIRLLTGSNTTLYRWRSATPVTAGQTVQFYVGAVSLQMGTGNNEQLLPIPPSIALPQGAHIKTDTVGLQAGDQWNATQFYVMDQYDV